MQVKVAPMVQASVIGESVRCFEASALFRSPFLPLVSRSVITSADMAISFVRYQSYQYDEAPQHYIEAYDKIL
jgi:hypothetical protein